MKTYQAYRIFLATTPPARTTSTNHLQQTANQQQINNEQPTLITYNKQPITNKPHEQKQPTKNQSLTNQQRTKTTSQ